MPLSAVRFLLYCLVFVLGAALSLLVQLSVRAWLLRRFLLFGAGCAAALAMLILGSVSESTLLMLFAVVFSVVTGFLILHGGRRTEFGTQIISQALGYRRFLTRASENHLAGMQRRNGQYFYELLSYAESIGMGEVIAKAFGDTELEPCIWYQDGQPPARTALEFYGRIREALDLLELSIRK